MEGSYPPQRRCPLTEVRIHVPTLEKRLFIPDQPYRKVLISDSDEWDMGFAFKDGICELHLYSNGIPEDENPVPLKKVVSELISSIESRLL